MSGHGAADRGGARRSVLVAHPGAELYGSDRVLLETVRGLVRAGVDVVLTLPVRGELSVLAEAAGARVVQCPAPVLRKSALTPSGLLGLLGCAARSLRPSWGLIRRTAPTAVLVNTTTLPFWALFARLAGCRVLVHVHEAERSRGPVLRFLLAAPLVLAHRVIVNSEFSLATLTDAAPWLSNRSEILPNGVAGPPQAEPPRAEVTGPVRLLFVGRLSPRKGPQLLPALLAELRARGVPATLTILGAVYPGYEWFEESLRAAFDEQDDVVWLGFDPEIWAHIAAADVVVVPSTVDEPFGNVAVEAVLGARPLIASATSGLLEAVRGYDCVQSVPPGDVGRWADAVVRVRVGWPEFRGHAVRDAATAHARHDPLRYQERVADVVLAADGHR